MTGTIRKRVTSFGAQPAVAEHLHDPWDGTWRGWGNTWNVFHSSTAVPGAPQAFNTARVGSAALAAVTSRITGVPLAANEKRLSESPAASVLG